MDCMVTASDADTVADEIKELVELARVDVVQRVVVDTPPNAQVERTVRTMDAARTVGACVLVKPAGQPIPPLVNMVVL